MSANAAPCHLTIQLVELKRTSVQGVTNLDRAEEHLTHSNHPVAQHKPVQSARWFAAMAIALCLVMSVPALCHGEDLRVCISDEPVPPLTYPDHDGQAQQLIRRAAQTSNVTVRFTALPWRRCLNELYSGRQNAAVVAYAQPHLPYVTFPMIQGQIDTSMAIGTLTNVVIRKTGSTPDWDGSRFSGLTRPVLIGSGLIATKNKISQLGIEIDDSAKSVPQMLNMLLSERAQIAIVRDTQAKEWIAEGPFQGKVEILPAPANNLVAFLGFNNDYFNRHRTLTRQIWSNMANQLKQSVDPIHD